ncbi:MAG: manganese ABC transporter ATP-binding protein [Bacteroidetes bacterium]|nr:MAG: manganese ABC transporter ATP-binding protein [Bacteroidota bacterium]PTM10584.1 MAG: manganese ABC transporter ATP-binding protein [Bacteroidota bacterium]
MNTTPAVITIEDLSVSYERKRVLSNVYLRVQTGHVYGVLGPNGAGKSTLFKAILGLVEVANGEIFVNGLPSSAQRKEVVYVPQKGEVDWTFPATVYDVVLMGRYPHKKVFSRLNAADHAKARAAMEELDIVALEHRQIGELSGGQQQRVFLARALCQEADIFLLDEPFVGVDVTTEDKIVTVLKNLAAAGKTLLVVHHDLSTVTAYFDQVVLLNQRVIAYGPTDVVFTEENIAKAYSGQLPILHQMGMLDE